MSAAAAFQATYSDWKLIRSRRCVQIILEIPLEASGDAYEVLGGMPNPGEEKWCAVARLEQPKEVMSNQRGDHDSRATPSRHDTSPASESASPDAPVRALRSPAQRSGMLCDKPKFWAFLRERGYDVNNKDQAADYVRMACDVQSRSEIRQGTDAEQRLNLIISAFQAWDLAPACGIVA